MNEKYDSKFEAMVADHQETLYGSHGVPGIAYKVSIMWRAHVWVLCTMSAMASRPAMISAI